MNWPSAHKRIRNGERVRRANWDTFIEQKGRRLRFILPPDLKRELGDSYDPTIIDMEAKDWVKA